MNRLRRSGARKGHPYRARSLVASVVAVAILASCGGDDSSADDPPDTSTTLVGSATTNPPAPTVPTSTEPPAPGPTQPVTSAPPDLSIGGYQIASDAAPPLLVGGKSDPVVSPLSDGVYWSWEYESDGDTIDFVLTQLFTGDACREQFGDDDAACASDNNTLYEPSATVTMPAEAVSVTVLDQDGQGGFDRYGVSPVEFVRLVADLAPASDAPAGFEFERHPVVVTIDDGEVVAVDHVFMS